MTTIIMDLQDRFLADDGTIVCTYDLLIDLARDGKEFHNCYVIEDPRIAKYNSISKNPLKVFIDDGIVSGPIQETFKWNTPKPFDAIDLLDYCARELHNKKLYDEKYLIRVIDELEEIDKRHMKNLVRHLAWMVSDWRKRKVVWGVGRGSSCASLVLFLIGLHRVDPIKYDISMTEFFR